MRLSEPYRQYAFDKEATSVESFSACNVLPPSLLTCLHEFIHVRRRPNLEKVAVLQRRMLRHELYSMIHVPRLKDENAAELFLGFRVGAVRGCDFAVLPVQGQGGLRRLKGFATGPVPVGAKMVVVVKARVEHGVSLGLAHAVEFVFVVVSQTDVFHGSSPHKRIGGTGQGVAPARSARDYGACCGAVVARLFTCFCRVLVPEPGRIEARAPRPSHRRRLHPCAPTRVPRPYWRLPESKNPPCAPWSRCTARL